MILHIRVISYKHIHSRFSVMEIVLTRGNESFLGGGDFLFIRLGVRGWDHVCSFYMYFFFMFGTPKLQ